MNGKEHLGKILSHSANHCGFWHGDPNPLSRANLFEKFGVKNDFEMGLKLGSTCRWVMPDSIGYYNHPEGYEWHDIVVLVFISLLT